MEHKTIIIRLKWRAKSSTDGYALFYGDVELTRDYSQLEILKFRLFDEEMTKYLKDGWKPYGNPTITDDKVMQFLTRELNPEPEPEPATK